MSSLRDVVASALLVAATVLGTLWLPAIWAERNVVDRDGFLAIAEPLSEEPSLQRSLSDSAVEQVLDDDRIPGWLSERLGPLLEEQAAGLTGTEAYASLWDTTMADLHTALFTPGPADLDVDLAPAIDELLAAAEEHLPVSVPRPDSATVTLVTIPDQPLLNHAETLGPWAHWTGPMALALALIAVVIAAHRRTMLTAAGLAGIVAGALTCAIAAEIETLVPDSVDRAAFVGPIVQVFQERFTAEVLSQGVLLLGLGALTATAGLVLVGLHRRS